MKKEDILMYATEVGRHTTKKEENPYSALLSDFTTDQPFPNPVKIIFYLKDRESEDDEAYVVGIVKDFTEECVVIVDLVGNPHTDDDNSDTKDIDYWINDIIMVLLDQIYMLEYEYEGRL